MKTLPLRRLIAIGLAVAMTTSWTTTIVAEDSSGPPTSLNDSEERIWESQAIGVYTSGDEHRWIAQQGTQTLSEGAFFEITGYSAEATLVRTVSGGRNWLMVGEGVIGLVGLLVATYPLVVDLEDPANGGWSFGSTIALIAGGGVLFGVGLSSMVYTGAISEVNKHYPATVAVAVADEHNRWLIREARRAAP